MIGSSFQLPPPHRRCRRRSRSATKSSGDLRSSVPVPLPYQTRAIWHRAIQAQHRAAHPPPPSREVQDPSRPQQATPQLLRRQRHTLLLVQPPATSSQHARQQATRPRPPTLKRSCSWCKPGVARLTRSALPAPEMRRHSWWACCTAPAALRVFLTCQPRAGRKPRK